MKKTFLSLAALLTFGIATAQTDTTATTTETRMTTQSEKAVMKQDRKTNDMKTQKQVTKADSTTTSIRKSTRSSKNTVKNSSKNATVPDATSKRPQ